MKMTKFLKILFCFDCTFLLSSCKGPDGKFGIPGGDARKTPADPKERVKKNLEEGRGFTLIKPLGIIQVLLILQAQMNYGELHLMY